MSRPALQLYFNLGAVDHLNVLHHAHDSSLAIATKVSGNWHEQFYKKGEAITKAEQLERFNVADSYVTQNAVKFGSHSRAFSNISCLANCFVDLDTYKVSTLVGLSKEEILQRIIKTFPDMPRPTLFADSGRGVYLIWTFQTTKPASFIPAWQVIQNNLVTLLKSFGADPLCKDVARVLRIAGTENSKSLTTAGYEQIGEPVKFEELQKYSNNLTKKNKPATKKHINNVRTLRTNFGTTTKNFYTLAYGRMQDIRTLAELRGGKLNDLRKTALYVYSASSAWYCQTVDSLERELDCFIHDCVANPTDYTKLKPTTVIKRKQDSIDGVTVTWKGKEFDARYRFRTDTVIKLLEITPEEQRHMKCLIGKAEKYDRKNAKRTEKRRKQGVVERYKYEQAAQERRRQALELFTKGERKANIAKLLGVSRAAVGRYLEL